MKKIGIIICARYKDCGGGKCFRALRERQVRRFKTFIETQFGIPVVVGTHPVPLKYLEAHSRLPFWDEANMRGTAGKLLDEDRGIMEAYN